MTTETDRNANAAENRPSRTRRGDGFASPGAVKAQGEGLPIYICNRCNHEVVWATSKRTGRKYLVTVSAGYMGQRFYIGKNVHTDEACARPMQDHIENLRSRIATIEQELAGWDDIIARMVERDHPDVELVRQRAANQQSEVADLRSDLAYFTEMEAAR